MNARQGYNVECLICKRRWPHHQSERIEARFGGAWLCKHCKAQIDAGERAAGAVRAASVAATRRTKDGTA